jgi:GC-rich sequence DNA-binding factor
VLQGGDEDDEDEDDAWVRQQLQKAGAASLSATPQQASTGSGSARDLDMARIPANATAADPVAQALAAGQSVMVSLREGLRRQQEKQQHVDRQQIQTKARLADSLQVHIHRASEPLQPGAIFAMQHLTALVYDWQAVTQLEGDVAAAAQKYTYLQEMRAFVADMCDMLQVRRLCRRSGATLHVFQRWGWKQAGAHGTASASVYVCAGQVAHHRGAGGAPHEGR